MYQGFKKKKGHMSLGKYSFSDLTEVTENFTNLPQGSDYHDHFLWHFPTKFQYSRSHDGF